MTFTAHPVFRVSSRFLLAAALGCLNFLAIPAHALKEGHQAPASAHAGKVSETNTSKRRRSAPPVASTVRVGLIPDESPRDINRPATAEQQGALSQLRAEHGADWVISWDSYGLPASAVGPASGKEYKGMTPENTGRAFIADYAALFGNPNSADLVLGLGEVDSQTGVTRVRFDQYYRGLPVYGTGIGMIFDRAGRISMFASSFHGDINLANVVPARTAFDAFDRVLGKLDPAFHIDHSLQVDPASRSGARQDYQNYVAEHFLPLGTAATGTSRLVILPFGDQYRLAWEVSASVTNRQRGDYRAFVDAHNGNLLQAQDEMMRVDVKAYVPDPQLNPAPVLVNVPLYKWNVATPLNFTTHGRQFNIQNSYVADTTEIPDGNFLHTADPECPVGAAGTPPCTTGDIHFDEQQTWVTLNSERDLFCVLNGGTVSTVDNSCSVPGLGADPTALNFKMTVNVHVPDAGPPVDPGYDNAFYSPAATTLNFGHGTWYEGTYYGLRDLALETAVAQHEYSHYITDRVTTNKMTSVPYGGGMNEGIADVWGTSINDYKYIGAFADPAAEYDDNSRIGYIRSMENTHMYCEVCRPNDCVAGTGAAANCEVHAEGEIYEGAMWQVYLDLKKYYGQIAARDIYQRLVFQHEKNLNALTAANIHFVAGRDALLSADLALYPATGGGAGKYDCSIWRGFASRGIGSGAATDTAAPYTNVNVTTLPASCLNIATVAINQSLFSCGSSTGYVTVTDPVPHNAGQVYNVTVTTTSGDSETFVVNATSSPVASATTFVSPTFSVVSGAVVVNDGKVQGANGAIIQVNFVDQDNVKATIGASATISCTAKVDFVSDKIISGSCDGNDPYLDANETATLRVTLKNNTSGMAMRNVVVTLASGNAKVTVNTPSVTIANVAAGANFTADFSVSANGTTTSTDSVTYTVGVTADGVNALASPVTFNNLLERDEVASTITDAFNFDTVTNPLGFFIGSFNAAGTDTTATDWEAVTCAGNPTTGKGWHWGIHTTPCATKYVKNTGYFNSRRFTLKPLGVRTAGNITQYKFDYKFDMDATVSNIPETITDSVLTAGFTIDDRIDGAAGIGGGETLTYVTKTYNFAPGGQPPVIDSNALGFQSDATYFWNYMDIDATTVATVSNGTIGWYEDNYSVTYTKYSVVADATSACSVPAASLTFSSVTINDGAYCSADAKADPGETFFMPVTITNSGNSLASGITGTLTATGGNAGKVTILTGTRSFPDLAGGSSGTSTQPYKLTINNTATAGEVFNFSLALTTAQGPFTVPFTLIVGHTVQDTNPANGYIFCNFDGAITAACTWVTIATENGANTGNWNRLNGGTAAGNGVPQTPFRRNCSTSVTDPAYESQPATCFSGGATGKCWVTDGGLASTAAGACGTDDVDPVAASPSTGFTTVSTPAYNASTMNEPYFEWKQYIFNLASASSSTFQVYISNDNGTTFTLVSNTLCSPGDAVCAKWTNGKIRIKDYFATPGTQVMVKFRARDAGTGTVSEALIDDFVFYNQIYAVTPIATAPAEVFETNPGYSKSGTNLAITWTAAAGATGYNVVRGQIPLVPIYLGVNANDASVYSTGITLLTTTIPQDSGSYFYLIQGYNATACQGSLGNDSSGIPRTRQ